MGWQGCVTWKGVFDFKTRMNCIEVMVRQKAMEPTGVLLFPCCFLVHFDSLKINDREFPLPCLSGFGIGELTHELVSVGGWNIC